MTRNKFSGRMAQGALVAVLVALAITILPEADANPAWRQSLPDQVSGGTKQSEAIQVDKITVQGLGQARVNHAIQGTNGTYYIATTAGTQLVKSDGSRVTYTTSTTPALAANWSEYVFVDTNGDLFIGHDPGGITIIHPDNTVTYWNQTTTPALSGVRIWHISRESDGNLYVSNRSTELDVIHPDLTVTHYANFTTPAIQDGSNSALRDPITGNIYNGSGSHDPTLIAGLDIIHPDGTTTFYNKLTNPALLNNQVVHLWKESTSGDVFMAQDSHHDGVQWLNDGGLSILHPNNTMDYRKVQSTPLFPSYRVHASWKDSQGTLYVNTADGLWRQRTGGQAIAVWNSILGAGDFGRVHVQPDGGAIIASQSADVILIKSPTAP